MRYVYTLDGIGYSYFGCSVLSLQVRQVYAITKSHCIYNLFLLIFYAAFLYFTLYFLWHNIKSTCITLYTRKTILFMAILSIQMSGLSNIFVYQHSTTDPHRGPGDPCGRALLLNVWTPISPIGTTILTTIGIPSNKLFPPCLEVAAPTAPTCQIIGPPMPTTSRYIQYIQYTQVHLVKGNKKFLPVALYSLRYSSEFHPSYNVLVWRIAQKENCWFTGFLAWMICDCFKDSKIFVSMNIVCT